MKIAIAQLNPTIGDLAGNSAQILEAAHIAAQAGTRLLLTPEMSLCGYPPRDLLLNPGFIAAMDQQLQAIATQTPPQLALFVGVVTANPQAHIQGEKPLHNSVAIIDGGQVQRIFHKQLLPTYDVFDEDRYFQPGEQSSIYVLNSPDSPTAPIRLGVTICEDLWNDDQFWGKRHYRTNPIADLAAGGVDLMVNLSASPYSLGKQQLRERMLHHVSTKYQTPIIYVNQVGGNDDLIFDGHSLAFDRQGTMVCRAQGFKSKLMVLDYDPQSRTLQGFAHHHQTPVIDPVPATEAEEIWQALVLGVRDYCRKCVFQEVVLGLSGGIDSALVAAIAATALGSENVLGVLMPSPYSSDHSLQDARALVENLGIRGETLAIAPAMAVYDELLAPLFGETSFGIAEENLQSRIRGNLLMALANKFGYLLLSTGNKSEMAVGYCTLYGDMNGGLAVIADVPKTKVYELCRWLNRHQEVIPPHILEKPPSAELRPDQVDQDSLPDYDTLDRILDRLICEHQSPAEVVAAGFEGAIVDRVYGLVCRAEFKRRQAAPGLKITDRAFGTGWRMPIAKRVTG